MNSAYLGAWLVLTTGLLAASPKDIRGQGAFELVTGKAFDSALPRDFYLEGNAIPTEKRNGILLKTPAGERVLIALIDTSGYSSQVRQKYSGMLIAEGRVSICGETVAVGSYGFGLDKPAPIESRSATTSGADAKFFLYNQAGEKVAECAAKKDTQIKQPKPLQVVLNQGERARLYLGRYSLELKP